MISVLAVYATLILGTLTGEEDYLAARAAEEARAYAQAVAAYEKCSATPGPLREYARVRLARCRAAAGDVPGAMALYQDILDRDKRGPWTRVAQLELARVLKNQGRGSEAAPLFAQALDLSVIPWWLQESASQAAENRILVAPADAASYAHFRGIVANTILIQQRLNGSYKLLGSPLADDRVLAVFGFLRSSEYKPAIETLVAAEGSLKMPDGAPMSLASLRAILDTGFAKAPDQKPAVTRIVEANASNPWMASWLYYGVRFALGTKRPADAAFLCDFLVKRFPASREMGESAWKMAEYHEGAGERALAEQYYAALASLNPKHRLAPYALFHAGRLRLKLGREAEGLQTWEALAREYPDHPRAAEGLYLAARHFAEKGDMPKKEVYLAKAAAMNVGDYFAHRALGESSSPDAARLPNLQVDGVNPVVRPFAIDAPPPAPLPAFIETLPAIVRLRLFAAHGYEESEWEAVELCDTFRGHPYEGMIYRILAEAGVAHTALEFANANGWGIKDGKKTLERLRLEYPRAYWPHVQQIAQEVSLDPYFVLSAARQESTFRPNLTSRAGAAGVMQVMPGTARYIVKIEPNLSTDDVNKLHDPRVSFRLGSYYLLRMIERGGGNLMYALASYNAGPGNCAKWRKAFGGYSFDAFIEAIPLTETRDYVKKVLANYAAYRSLYPEHIQQAARAQ